MQTSAILHVDAPPRTARLLILACSATKRRGSGCMPAWNRYDGPLCTADPVRRKASGAFLSTRYGFRTADSPIGDYDARPSQGLAGHRRVDHAMAAPPRSGAV